MTIIKEIGEADTWFIRRAVLWPDKVLDFVRLEEDSKGEHYGLYEDNILVSVISCFHRGEEMQFRKFATIMTKQRQGFGTSLLNYAIEIFRSKGVKRIWCNARVNQIDFYGKFGMIKKGDPVMKNGVEYIVMELRF